MLLLIGFAFLAGVVTVLSPCILPVLPVVLSGGVGGGKARPWGVITGFLLSFTTFTLTLSALVQALGLDPEVLRWVAAGLILVFGIVLVVPALKTWFLTWATRLVSRPSAPMRPGKPAGGYWAGLVLGLGLGVVWTPCVGPIMASVITLALSQTVDLTSVFITLAYTLGTSIPLFLIMVGGRGLLNRAPWLGRHSSALQRIFGVLMVVTAVALFTGADRAFSTWLLTTFPSYGSGLTSLENQPAVRAELDKRRTAAPASTADPLTLGQGDGGTPWLVSAPMTLASLKGKVVLVDFWTYSCINCVRTIPYLRDWYAKYHDKGLEIIGVHSPEFAFEQKASNVLMAIKDLGVTWPVVQDNAFGIWNAYQNQYWPAHYLYGRDGAEIERHFGEGHYAETEAAIAAALGVAGPQGTAAGTVGGVIPVSEGPKTPETYLGYGRGSRFASPEDVTTDAVAPYTLPGNLEDDQWALSGRWLVAKEYSRSEAGSGLRLRFQGARVYLVMHPVEGNPRTVRVTVDGKPVTGGDVKAGVLTLDRDRLYQLVDQQGPAGGTLEVTTDGQVQVYAFTFG